MAAFGPGGPGGRAFGGRGRGARPPRTADGRLLGLLALHLGRRLAEIPAPRPAAALGLLGACVLAHWGPALGLVPPGAVPAVRAGCLRPGAVRAGAPLPWRRLLWPPFLHANDLYHNMFSLLHKGFGLELALGSARFAALCLYLLAATQALHVGAARAAGALGVLPGERRACVVGFSGVLFGLKVVGDAQLQGEASFLGLFGVPLRHAAWAELVSIQLVHPDASFLGHLCGILAGCLWLCVAPGRPGPPGRPRRGPLRGGRGRRGLLRAEGAGGAAALAPGRGGRRRRAVPGARPAGRRGRGRGGAPGDGRGGAGPGGPPAERGGPGGGGGGGRPARAAAGALRLNRTCYLPYSKTRSDTRFQFLSDDYANRRE